MMWELDRLRESLDRRAWELEERERDFFLFEERRKRELACEEDELTMKRVRFLSEVRMKEEDLDLRLEAANERAEWLDMAEADVREMRREVSERLQSSDAEGERLRLERESLAEREKTADARINAAEKREEEFNSLQEAKMREIKLKEEELGKRSEEFAGKVRVWEREMAKHRFAERIEFAEKKLDSLKVKMEKSFKKLEYRCIAKFESLSMTVKEADSISESLEKRLEELEQMRMEFSSIQEEKARDLALKEQLINSMREELVKDIEFREEQLKDAAAKAKIFNAPLKIFNAPLMIEPDDSADLKFTVRMDGKTLQMFLNDAEKDMESMGDEIFKVLHLSSDPAKLVLDAMEGFYPPHLRKEDVECNVRRTCISLLEQLIKMTPKIKGCVREEAMGVAVSWRSKMRDARTIEVLGFLFLLSAFDLVSYFDKDEISSLVMVLST